MQNFKTVPSKYRGGKRFITDKVIDFKKIKIVCHHSSFSFNCFGRLMTNLKITKIIRKSGYHSNELDFMYNEEENFCQNFDRKPK